MGCVVADLSGDRDSEEPVCSTSLQLGKRNDVQLGSSCALVRNPYQMSRLGSEALLDCATAPFAACSELCHVHSLKLRAYLSTLLALEEHVARCRWEYHPA